MPFTGQLGTPNSQLGEIELGQGPAPSGAPPVEGGTVGRGTAGTAPVGSWSLNTTGPSIMSLSPINGATGVDSHATVTIVWTAPDGIDPWSLQVTLAGQPAVAGGFFYSGSYGGSILVDKNTATITISTHPTFATGTVALSTTATDLEANTQTSNTTFSSVNNYVVGVSDTVTVTDSLVARYNAITTESDTVVVTDSLASRYHAITTEPDTVTVSDSLAARYHAVTTESDTVTVTDATTEHHAALVSVSDTITVTDAVDTANHYANFLSDTVTVSDSLTPHYRAVASGSDTVAVTDASAELHRGLAHVADTVTVTDAISTGRRLSEDVSDTVTVSDTLAATHGTRAGLSETVGVSDALTEGERNPVNLVETVSVSEGLGVTYEVALQLGVTVVVEEAFSAGAASISGSETSLEVTFQEGLRIDGVPDLSNYSLIPSDGPGFPVELLAVDPVISVLGSGTNASTFVTTALLASNITTTVYVVEIPTVNFLTSSAKYIFLNSPSNPTTFLRIVQVLTQTTVQVDRPIVQDPLNGHVLWQTTSGVEGVLFVTSKFTNGGGYTFSAQNLTTFPGDTFAFSGDFTASSSKPQVVSAESLGDGSILVTFNEDMLVDPALQDPTEYKLTGAGSPYVESVATVSSTEVLLFTRNLEAGSFSLQVGTHTPHDSVGNPIDPLFNTVAFTTSDPIDARSIFTDFGPIARPPLTLEQGVGVSFTNPTTVVLTGAAISPGFAGYLVTLTGTSHNDGTYQILTVISQTTLKLDASFNLPDPNAFMAAWTVVNPRDGEIADDPAHVTVTINGSPVVPEEVVGLLGQIVLATPPIHGQDIRVGYSWITNPTVEVRRLNSKEFRLNSWNRDLNYLPLVEHYRYNNVLPVTTNFTSPPPIQQGSAASIVSTTQVYVPDGNVLTDYAGLNLVITAGLNAGVYDIVSVPDNHHINVTGPLHFPDPQSGHIPWTIGDTSDIQAILPQPLLRDLKYRAYERAYTALLNDPNTLTLNAAPNLIAYPPLARIVAQTFVSYEPTGLPQNDPVAPWTVVGTGTAAVVSLQLVVTSPTSGDFPVPGGSPIYWTQTVDQSFPHVFASTWDMQVNATPVTQGVFTGVAFGYSDTLKAIVFGYLNDGGTHKVGFLVKGAGNDPSVITAWTGGLDATGNPLNAPLTYDWSILTSYRIYNDAAGNVSLYLNGSVVPSLMVTEDQLPYLEELAAPFNTLQGVFWGSLSSNAQNTSTWEFVRYIVLPLNPLQTAPSIFVDYVANVLPEDAAKPWTPVGYHGTETILASAFLLLDSTSAVPAAEESLVGLVGGDYRGFFRIEPLIATSAEVVVDFNVALRTWTQGFSPNALMVAIDDSDRLIQLSFISDTAAPKFSYGGDGLPTVQNPPWTALGGQTGRMVGRTLQIVDASTTDGLVYVIDDTNPVTSDNNHFVQNAIVVAGSSVTASASVKHAAHAAIVASSNVLPDAQLNAAGVSHTGLAAITAGASLTASATVNRGAVAAISAVAGVEANVFVSPHTRVVSPDNGYILEARLQPLTWTADPSGFIGAMAEVYDSARSIGFALYSIAGTPYVALQGEGTVVAQFPFNWNDGKLHTYRVVYALAAPVSVVTLFIDGLLVGTPQNYTSFPQPIPPSTVGFVAFGSSVPGSTSVSTVNWIYCNAWRVETGQKFVGIWRGTTTGSLIDYWVPTKATGSNALILGNALMDTAANFTTAGVQTTDYLIVDVGPNAGIYQITGVTPNTLAVDKTWPQSPSRISYRIAQQLDWTQPHAYRIVKAPSGDDVAVFIDSSDTPLIFLTYDDHILPPSSVGLPRIISGTLPSVVWGAFDPTNLSQSSWQYFRYGVTRSPTELRIVPPHQVLNQRNLIESFERHLSNIPHTLTDFWSESEGIVPNTYPDFLTNPGLTAYTLLNEITPLVPETQTYEVQTPTPVIEFVGGLNNIANVLNSNAFLLNDATRRVALIVPDNVLYNSLQIIERDTGFPNLIAPFDDESQPNFGPLYFQNEVCLVYNAQTFPENDPTAITPWTFFAQDPSHVTRSVFGGVFTYGTDATGTQTVYTNATPLPDSLSMDTTVTFRLKVLLDSSGGLGDSQIRFGFSAIGLTASLALVSAPTGLRYVLVIDQLTNTIIAGIPFDFYDGQFHTYTLVRNPATGTVQVSVD